MEQNIVNLNDSAELYAYLSDQGEPVLADDLLSVAFTIEKPNGAKTTETGTVMDDGAGYLMFNDTDQVGEYVAVATFIFTTGKVKSTRSDFEVGDPFNPTVGTQETVIEHLVWDKVEDCFDSRDGGPWLREMTLNVFDRSKMSDFIDEALLEINVYNPPTHFDENYFVHSITHELPLLVPSESLIPSDSLILADEGAVFVEASPNEDTQILVLGTFLSVVRHLMRSYVEQPLPSGGQITYEDRRDYLQRWGTIYQIESMRFDALLKLWKRQFLGLNQGKVLVSSKAGRLSPAPMRTRNIGRGYY